MSWLPLGPSRRIFRTLAWWHVGFKSRAAETTRTNLALCFPDLSLVEREDLTRRSLAESACLIAEAGATFHWPTERCFALAPNPRLEPLHQALAADKGVLALVPHFGNWEFLSVFMGQFQGMALYDPPRVESLAVPLLRARQRSGMRLLPIDAGGLRAAYRCLADRGVIALLPDQVPDRRAGVYAPFFGTPALTMTFAHRLIQRTRPTVLLALARRCEAGFQVEVRGVDEGIHDPDPIRSATAMNRAIEAVVLEDPAQYQWEYKRFRRQPPGLSDPYRIQD